MNKLLTGIYVVEYRWELILLRRGLEEDLKTVRPEDFRVLLLQSFDIDYITKILDNLYSNTKLLIDFDRCKVKVIKPKDIDSLDFIQMVYALYGNALAKRKDHLIRINNQGLRLNIKEVNHFRCKYEYGFTVKSGYIIIRNCGYIMVFGDFKK